MILPTNQTISESKFQESRRQQEKTSHIHLNNRILNHHKFLVTTKTDNMLRLVIFPVFRTMREREREKEEDRDKDSCTQYPMWGTQSF